MNFLRTSLALVVCFGLSAVVRAEDKVELDKLPAKVKEAVKAKFPDAELVSAAKEKDGDKTIYEVTIKNKKKNIDVTVSEDGKIVSVEVEIDYKALPKAVAEAFAAKYSKAKVTKCEEITKDGKVTFEVIFSAGGKDFEAVFEPTGKFVSEEDTTKKK